MPIYEYTCLECETRFEKLVRSMAQVVEVHCPECGGTHVKKGWSLFGTGQATGRDGAMASAASGCAPTGTWGIPRWEPWALTRGDMMTVFGLSSDLVLLIVVLVGWFVLMRFILPRLGVSTWMASSCRVASPREEEEQVTEEWARPAGG